MCSWSQHKGRFKRHSAVSVRPMLPLWDLVENTTEGTQMPQRTSQSVSRVDIWPNWVPQMLLPENLDLKVGDTQQPRQDIRSKACQFGKGIIAVIVNRAQRPKESQGLERTAKQEAEQQKRERPGAAASTPGHHLVPTLLCRLHQILIFTITDSCRFWWPVTKRSLRQSCQPTLSSWQASKTAFL